MYPVTRQGASHPVKTVMTQAAQRHTDVGPTGTWL